MGIFSPSAPTSQPIVTEPKQPSTGGADPSGAEAQAAARKRREQLAKQTGRRQLRIDLATPSEGAAGIQTGVE